MRKVLELEAWSIAGLQLDTDYGKKLQTQVWAMGVDEDVFLGLSNTPDAFESKRLKHCFTDGDLTQKEFYSFCTKHHLEPNINSAVSASKFLEYAMGIPIAWIHLDVNDTHQSKNNLERIIRFLALRDCYVFNPVNGLKITTFNDVLHYFPDNTSTSTE